MLELLTQGFSRAKNLLTGQTRLTEANIESAVREIRVSLLEADVDVQVVSQFIERVRKNAIGELVTLEIDSDKKKLKTTPEDHFTFICQKEIAKLLGPRETTPIVFKRPFTTIMMIGLQGTGKTTTCAKLAHYLKQQHMKPMLVAADIYRPAAVDQLQILGKDLSVPVFHVANMAPPLLCQAAIQEAKQRKRDVIIFDTAGRLAIDEILMTELEAIKQTVKPDNIFLVCDAMMGQDAVRTASEFNRRLDITGLILSKMDGDARGGVALSMREVTGKPIKFLGVGENTQKLEVYRPEGLASRILGMGDVVGLMQDFEGIVDEKQAERDARKMLKGQFTLQDFLEQIKMIKRVGSVRDILAKLPLFPGASLPNAGVDDKVFVVMESMIQSMTIQERGQPDVIDKERMLRIAKGSGRSVEQVQELLQKFFMMQTMMGNIAAQPALLGSLPGMQQLIKSSPGGGFGKNPFMVEFEASVKKAQQAAHLQELPVGTLTGFNDFSVGQNRQSNPDALQLQKQKAKAKRKAEKFARKKSRRR